MRDVMSLKSDDKPEKRNYWWSPLQIVALGSSLGGYRNPTLFQPSAKTVVATESQPEENEQIKPK